MVTKECKMKDFSRLDASPAAMLVQLASRFESSIYVDQGAKRCPECPPGSAHSESRSDPPRPRPSEAR